MNKSLDPTNKFVSIYANTLAKGSHLAPSQPNISIGQQLRDQRINVLKLGLREMARLLDIAPAHLTDLEKGRRNPSEDLLVRICGRYKLPIATLRTGWQRAEAIVDEVATQDETTAEKVPAFLRTARHLTSEQWDQLIKQAEKVTSKKSPRRKK